MVPLGGERKKEKGKYVIMIRITVKNNENEGKRQY